MHVIPDCQKSSTVTMRCVCSCDQPVLELLQTGRVEVETLRSVPCTKSPAFLLKSWTWKIGVVSKKCSAERCPESWCQNDWPSQCHETFLYTVLFAQWKQRDPFSVSSERMNFWSSFHLCTCKNGPAVVLGRWR